jgi:hypothetical protein
MFNDSLATIAIACFAREQWRCCRHEQISNPAASNKGNMLSFPTFTVVGVRADGARQVLAQELTPYREAEETRKAMLASAEFSKFPTIVVERGSPPGVAPPPLV